MSVNFYNKNAKDFFENTLNANMKSTYSEFLKYIPDNGTVLDLGCGSGRDSKAFLNLGYDVTSLDLSSELSKMAEEYIGRKVLLEDMRNINFKEKFDGIWACASLLHLTREDLSNTFTKIHKSLKKNGILYASFKYGEKDFSKKERLFTCFTEKTILENMVFSDKFKVKKIWITGDVREGREEEKWLNILLRKL